MSEMPLNQELNNLSFENSVKDEITENKKDSGSRFRVILTFSLLVLFFSIGILGYYLFINNNSQQLITTVEKVEKSEKETVNFTNLSKNSEYQVSIYLSMPKKEIEYLGQGIFIGNGSVITSYQVIKEFKPENLIIKKDGNNYEVSHMLSDALGTNSGLWTAYLKSSNLSGAAKFEEKEVSVGDLLYAKSTKVENKEGGLVEEINAIYPFNIVGKSEDGSIILTNLQFVESGNPVYNGQGVLIGITSNLDSKNFLKIVVGSKLKEFLVRSGQILDKNSNKDKLGVAFEFSDLEKFRKEGRPVGLIVREVKDGQLAQIAGIKKDDIILTINNQVIVSEDELDKLFQNLNAGEEIKFEIIREDKKVGITLNLE